MRLVIATAMAIIFVVLFKRAIAKAPIAFYAAAIAADALFAYGITYSMPPALWDATSIVVQRCTVATALFAIVMYVGAMPDHSRIRKSFAPIRSELAIIACILAFGHSLNYLNSYLNVMAGSMSILPANQFVSLLCAIALFALLLLLGVTSLKLVRQRMHAPTWKAVQRCSYAFFGLIYLHALLILSPSAAVGAGDALEVCIAYSILFLPYPFLRIYRHYANHKTSKNLCIAREKVLSE